VRTGVGLTLLLALLACVRVLREVLSPMPRVDSKSLSTEAFLALFAGLGLTACQKSSPEASAEATRGVVSAAPVASVKAPAAPSAREVPAPAGSAKAEKEGGCAPGGCAPGQCGANKKE
jgi:hypothetical protein